MKRHAFMVALAALILALPAMSGLPWRDVDGYGPAWTFDRGVEYGYFADTTGTVHQVVLRRKWITAPNDQVRAMPVGMDDTTGQGYDLVYRSSGPGRWQWYAPPSMPSGIYDFLEINGSPDSAIAGFTNIRYLGETAPDSFVPSSAIELGAIDTLRVDRTQIPILRGDSLTVTRLNVTEMIRGVDTLRARLLWIGEQLDTPDIRCLGCDSIKVNQLAHFEQGIQVEDTLTARTQGATGGVIAIEDGFDPPTRAFLFNSSYGADFGIDVVAPTFPGAVTSGNASSAGSFIVFDGSSNYATIQQPSIGSNPLIKLPTTWTDGMYLKASVSGSTITLSVTDPLASQKWEWSGQKTWTENSNTWQYFVIPGMNAPDCYDPATTASWPVTITPAYFSGTEKRFTGYVSNDTLTVTVVSPFTADWKLNIHIRESD